MSIQIVGAPVVHNWGAPEHRLAAPKYQHYYHSVEGPSTEQDCLDRIGEVERELANRRLEMSEAEKDRCRTLLAMYVHRRKQLRGSTVPNPELKDLYREVKFLRRSLSALLDLYKRDLDETLSEDDLRKAVQDLIVNIERAG